MAVLRAAEIQTYEVDGIRVQGLATPSRGALEVMVWRNQVPSGRSFPAASRDHEQIVVILDGAGVLREGGLEVAFGTGDVLIIPANSVCQIVAAEEGPCLDSLIAMPLGTRHFTTTGSPMRLPWTT